MLTIIIALVSLFAFAVGFAMAREHFRRRKNLDFINSKAVEKAMLLEKIMDMAESNRRVTNDEVENLLGVSDSTAERYLEELEGMGRIRQVGESGRGVYYEAV